MSAFDPKRILSGPRFAVLGLANVLSLPSS
jgi:hypothetical protein